MSVINQPGFKHRFEGIGEVGAALFMAALAGNPGLVFLTAGLLGKFVWFSAKLLFMFLASLGLVVFNVGAEKIETTLAHVQFDGSWESALRFIAEIQKQGRGLTDEEVQAINAPVKDAFRRFGRFGRVRKR